MAGLTEFEPRTFFFISAVARTSSGGWTVDLGVPGLLLDPRRPRPSADRGGRRVDAGRRVGWRAMPSSTIDIATPDGAADAYLTRPDDGERHPGVLLLMDAVGLRPRR